MLPHQTLTDLLNSLPLDKFQRQDLQYYIEKEYDKRIVNFSKLENYLYRFDISHADINYENARKHFDSIHNTDNDVKFGACTSFIAGPYLCRNYDWYYTEDTEFVIKTNRLANRFKSIGICTNRNITNAEAAKGIYDKKYNLLPFFTTCGINENGVSVSINVVPKQNKATDQNTGKAAKLSAVMIPRYVLDYATSATQICNIIANYIDWYCSKDNEFHFIIADKNDVCIVEFINNQTVITRNPLHPFITNFHIYNTRINNNQIDYDSVEPYGQGVERYQYLLNHFPFNSNIENIKTYLQDLKYTNAYTNRSWLTEFAGIDGLTVQQVKYSPSDYNDVLNRVKEAYDTRLRNGKTWQTMHSTCYDLINKKMYLGVQENPLTYCFELKDDYILI